MLKLILISVLLTSSPVYCNAPGVKCLTDIAFTIIAEVFQNKVDIGVRLYCPVNHHCVSNSETPCQPNYVPDKTTEPTTTKTLKTTTAASKKSASLVTELTYLGDINCEGPGYYRAEKCNEYYECAPLYMWFRANLGTCKEGYFFSEVNKPCSMPPNVVCTDIIP